MIERLRRCFTTMYVKLPKSRRHQIEQAEKLTPEWNRIWEELVEEVSELTNDFNWKIKPDTAFEDLAMGAMVSQFQYQYYNLYWIFITDDLC